MPLRAHYDNIKGVAPQSHTLVLGRRTQRGPSVLPLLPARLQRRSASRTRRYREQHRGRASGRTNKNKFFGVLRSRATGCANLDDNNNDYPLHGFFEILDCFIVDFAVKIFITPPLLQAHALKQGLIISAIVPTTSSRRDIND